MTLDHWRKIQQELNELNWRNSWTKVKRAIAFILSAERYNQYVCLNHSLAKWKIQNVYYVTIGFLYITVLPFYVTAYSVNLCVCACGIRAALAKPFSDNSIKWKSAAIIELMACHLRGVPFALGWHNEYKYPIFNCQLCIRIFISKDVDSECMCATAIPECAFAILDFN